MILKKLEYGVKPVKVEEVKRAITQLVFNVKENEPAVMFYETFQLGNTGEFIHFISFMNPKAEEEHKKAGHTLEFFKSINASIVKKPIYTDLNMIATNKTRLQ